MAARARRSSARTAYDDLYADQPYAHGEFLAGERIGPAPARSGGKILLRGIVVLIALGTGWAVLSGQVTWPAWLPTDMAAVWSSIDRRGPGTCARRPRREPSNRCPPPISNRAKGWPLSTRHHRPRDRAPKHRRRAHP